MSEPSDPSPKSPESRQPAPPRSAARPRPPEPQGVVPQGAVPQGAVSQRTGGTIGDRKAEHIDLCVQRDVEGRSVSTLLDEVWLLHDSLPELDADAIDLGTVLCGRRLPTPILVTGMTGGIDEAGRINRVIASAAQELGLAFGVGSQRPMLRDPGAADSYRVRDVAPDVFLLANIGAVQAADLDRDTLRRLVDDIGADALCVHLNPAQEMIQPGGDRDFRGCLDALARAATELGVPVIAKETGAGMSPSALRRLHDAGVRTVDVSGAGGTTWVGVEALRAGPGRREVGEVLWDWGVPTAAATVFARRAGLEVIASGGVRDGLDVARALALGASAAGAALPFLRAAAADGLDGVRAVARSMLETLRAVMLLTGSPDIASLRATERRLGPTLRAWVDG